MHEWMKDWIDDIIDAELEFIGCDKGLCCFVNHSTERESFVRSLIQWFVGWFNYSIGHPNQSESHMIIWMNRIEWNRLNEWDPCYWFTDHWLWVVYWDCQSILR